VSVVVPAYNAADTLTDTLDSLLAQSAAAWEAIVIDDGSTDATGDIAARYARWDRRVRLARQPHAGEAAARNIGIQLARFDWLLFLDADDWLLPRALERLTSEIAPASQLDLVYGGWVRISRDGQTLEEQTLADDAELFPITGRYCPFAIHSCIVRRALVQELGGFDSRLRVGADWDLWQRVGRAGARLRAVPEVHACYRMRPHSAATNVSALLEFGLRVIERGHAADARVRKPLPAYAQGLPVRELATARFHFACWPAGMLIGRNEDARRTLAPLSGHREMSLEPAHIAHTIFKAALVANASSPQVWETLWPRVRRRAQEFLLALEQQSGSADIAARALAALEELIRPYSRPMPGAQAASERLNG
jgi:hypothetical protein